MPLVSVVPVLTFRTGTGFPPKWDGPETRRLSSCYLATFLTNLASANGPFPGHGACSAMGEITVDVRDGFIVGIFNYCDRWCDECAFTSRCRLFADKAEMEASLDPALKALVEATPFEPPSPPPPWLAELLQELDTALCAPTDGQEPRERPLLPEQVAIEERADAYRAGVFHWSRVRDMDSTTRPHDPAAVISWFHTLISAKVHRALHGLAGDHPEERDWPPDHDGSAKVALLGIDRSHAGWLALVESGTASDAEVAPFIADLVWLGEALERVFPNARSFVRPAFDESDEVSKLLSGERG